MCGISGIFDLRGKRNVDQPLLKAMNRSQAHRGPDGEGYHFEPGVGLGHRRLAIIDLEGGAQPGRHLRRGLLGERYGDEAGRLIAGRQ